MTGTNNINNKGFSMIEIIVALAVFFLIVGTAVGLFVSIVAVQRRILSEQQLISQSSYAIEYMSKALRMATKDEEGECVINPEGPEVFDDINGVYVLTRYENDPGIYTGIRFLNASNVNGDGDPICQEFLFDGNPTDGYILKEIKSTGSFADINIDHAVALTSEKIKITNPRFKINASNDSVFVFGTNGTDPGHQPRVTILMTFKALGGSEQMERKVQTTVSARNLNIE
ncbi:MAG: hypothetical protein A2439_03610 [Candidatus Staskawiczbacteria bacterium RIFOXYC2_FULL_37_17]|nr:MAG: hypothetical protein A2280_00250 [Candidatus Staskawiczbacteria bacterium RIFOXYA12_FULL_37_10]OGZ80838.1 MAG: hypothetical protein A2353_01195 [Candidatus Staskawiczbacteria bacterium RIFOXYB1_FULL_38_37]OGZ82704.1 MAG: hypothetical protein A2325_01535 [Candidatus Staskawiczbacteria bacterium RIFOXYB2_FULL_37_10]OGZ86820.1 MAG: hypothetical protein A2439_03610 [Candidatus Staskawiczbacteria bacterium RIFOXYC2_FULL_37_17]HCC60073.1 hypothetical protein [Candidatus Staskawiczbacteria bac